MSDSLRNYIKAIIQEVETEKELKPKMRLSPVSLDDQVDSLILKYESETLAESLKRLLLKEEEEEADKEDANKEPSDKTKGSEELKADGPAEEDEAVIDINSFTKNVARLIMNYTSLLDIETVIINRAKNHIENNFGPGAAEEFEGILEDEFGLAIEPKDNEPRVPAARGAGPSV